MKSILTLLALLIVPLLMNAQTNETIFLWPDSVPGESDAKHPPRQDENTSGNVIRLTDVTDPAFIVLEPEASFSNGAGVIVCPGGGGRILAWDKEGLEVGQWFNTLGITAFVLQYRVPKKQEGALMDIQRAIRIIRSRAEDWKLDKDKLGVIGFSAGGSLCARASTLYREETYPMIDNADTLSCRPDFSMLIYGAGLDRGERRSLTPELKVDENTPPMFLFATADDRHGNGTLVMAGALRDAGIPVESHLLPFGGHGYGLRVGNIAGETWPMLAEQWLKNILK